MKQRFAAMAIACVLIAFAFAGCGLTKPNGHSGHDSEPTEYPIAYTEPPAGVTKDFVILINNTGDTIEHIYISSNDVEYWGEPLELAEIMNGASCRMTDFGRDVASYDKPVDIAFTLPGYAYFFNARNMDVRPGDRIRMWCEEDESSSGTTHKIPYFEITHADGNIRIYEGNARISVDGTDKKPGWDNND